MRLVPVQSCLASGLYAVPSSIRPLCSLWQIGQAVFTRDESSGTGRYGTLAAAAPAEAVPSPLLRAVAALAEAAPPPPHPAVFRPAGLRPAVFRPAVFVQPQ